MTEFDPVPDALTRLTELARSAAQAPVRPSVHRSGRAELIAVADERRLRAASAGAAWSRWLALAALGGGGVAAALSIFVWLTTERPLTYQIHGGRGNAPDYVAATSDAPASVHFSDGSAISAGAGARLRIESTRVDGARVLLENGRARADVKHRRKTSWLFVAGPFEVHVTGTRFSLNWDQEHQAIDLMLHEGSVEVRSPLGSSHCVVRTGQRFRASLSAGTMQLENSTSDSSAAPTPLTAASRSPEPAPAPAAPEALDGPASARAHGSSAHAGDSWPALVRRGSFQDVIEAAQARGLRRSLESSSAEDLRGLADAARYLGQFDLAERSLSALRQRFAGTRHAAAATFLLGRTYEASGRIEPADRQYVRYLSEAPRGEFAADALAGHMRSVAALSGPRAARPIAREYLRRYRDGVHRQLAQQFVSGD